MKKTFHVKLDGPANAVVTNRDFKLVAVAGRHTFRVYAIDRERLTFTERVALRYGRNLTYASNDIAWNPVDDTVLATGATNGQVVIWDLNRVSHPKVSYIFRDHQRTINTVNFHPTDVNLLISGSTDGTMKLFDLRVAEAINTFKTNASAVLDLQFSPHSRSGYQIACVMDNGNVQIWDSGRLNSPLQQFTAHNGPAYTVDWHPNHSQWLGTGGRDMHIKVWDLENRNSLQYSIQTIAAVARVRWRPDHKFQIAHTSQVTDFSVSVWDIRRPFLPFALFTEHKDMTRGFVWIDGETMLSAGRDSSLYHHFYDESVKPMQRANPMALDISNPGDAVLAHRIPLSSTLSSNHNHSSLLTSASAHHHHQPHSPSLHSTVSCVTPVGSAGPASSSLPSVSSPILTPTSLNPGTPSHHPLQSVHSSSNNNNNNGGGGSQSSVTSGTGSNLIHSILSGSSSVKTAGKRLSSIFHKSPQSPSQRQQQQNNQGQEPIFECASSVLYINGIAALSMEWFVESATAYQLTGRSFDDLCQNNADVAYRLGRIAVYNAWRVVRERYGVSRSSSYGRSDASSSDKSDPVTCENNRLLSHLVSSNVIGPLRHVNGNKCPTPVQQTDAFPRHMSPGSGAGSDFFDQSDSDDSYVNIHPIEDSFVRMSEKRDSENTANFFFGDGDWSTCAASLTYPSFLTREILGSSPPQVTDQDLPDEGFMLRHEIPDFPNPPSVTPFSSSPPKSSPGDSCPASDETNPDSKELGPVMDMLYDPCLSMSKVRPMMQKDEQLMAKILRSFASEGDVQSCVSLLIVLGDRMKELEIDDITQEKWFTAYVDLLYRFQLWSVATQVISLSQIANVNSLNQMSTNVNLCCGNCGKLNHGTGPFVCKNCDTQTCICCVCNETVYGLYAWCEGCSHGGHLLHLKQWYDDNSRCPTGCGHECEYAAAR